jgi:hypothetical protein
MSDPRWLRSQSLVISSDKTLAACGRTTRRFSAATRFCTGGKSSRSAFPRGIGSIGAAHDKARLLRLGRQREHSAQCLDPCGRCGRKWRPPFWCSGIAACLIDVECDLVTRVKNQQLLRCSASAKPQACLSMCGCTLNGSRHRCFVPERCNGTRRAGIACYANGQVLACVYFEDATLHG